MTTAHPESADETKEPPPSPATRAYMQAALQMHRDMAIPFTGNADTDFAAIMAAHQKGTIALAKVELQHGTNAHLKHLAEKIIASNEADIAALTAHARHQ